jgi:hypothetical protein
MLCFLHHSMVCVLHTAGSRRRQVNQHYICGNSKVHCTGAAATVCQRTGTTTAALHGRAAACCAMLHCAHVLYTAAHQCSSACALTIVQVITLPLWDCRLPKLHTVKLKVDNNASLPLLPFSTMLYSLHSQLPSLSDLTVTCQVGLRRSALPWRELGRATRLTRLVVEVSGVVF